MRETVSALRELVTPASARRVGPGAERVLPVAPALRPLLPWPGLRRGAALAAGPGTGGLSILLALASRASREGAWIAAVGLPALGVVAADELGVRLDRLVLVPDPGNEPLRVLGMLADGVEVLLAGGPWLARVTPTQAQRVTARLRQRGAVLLARGAWPGADVTLHASVVQIEGLRHGHGRIRGRRLAVEAAGRGIGRRRRLEVLLPGADGGLAAVEPDTRTVEVGPGPVRAAVG